MRMSQLSKARKFASLHVKGTPLILYNVWDAGSAKAIVDAGAVTTVTRAIEPFPAASAPDK